MTISVAEQAPSSLARMTRRGFILVAFFVSVFSATLAAAVAPIDATNAPSRLLTLRGQTMGTTYMVKIHDAPADQAFADETAMAVERELRRVNDQMSTYLQSSELSRFNDSTSTEWFPVSPETAMVVSFAQAIAAKTDGAFDVTVGPLVDRWSFGPSDQTPEIPADDELESLGEQIGYRKLSVRLQPPALRKSMAALRVDLSAIAKGHAVDRVVEMLQDADRTTPAVRDLFVEIGGEVRVTGSKGGDTWKVGIQRPDAAANQVMVAHPMEDSSMATSGDYRNAFEIDGVRYSHTIDPVTRRPVTHGLASVTVVADSCMGADGWATAMSVLGRQRGWTIAEDLGLSVLFVQRTQGGYEMSGTGSLQTLAEASTTALGDSSSTVATSFGQQMIPVTIMTLIGLSVILIAMAVGVIFGRKSISGSCGGLNAKTDADGTSRCSMCSTPSEACKELREKVGKENPADVLA